MPDIWRMSNFLLGVIKLTIGLMTSVNIFMLTSNSNWMYTCILNNRLLSLRNKTNMLNSENVNIIIISVQIIFYFYINY